MKQTYHQAIIQHSSFGQAKFANLVPKRYTCHHSSSRRTQATAKRDWVNDMNPGFRWKGPLPVTSQDVQGCPCDQIGVDYQWNLVGTLALIRDDAIERHFRGFGFDLDPNFKPD
jgi:hypothetical protein